MTDDLGEAGASGLPPPRQKLRGIARRLRTAGLFAAGVAAALLAVLLYGQIVPGPHQLNQGEVRDTVASVLASQTPAPAASELVYQAIRPSLVLVETQLPTGTGKAGEGIGTGVVIDQAGDILTCLHVVAGADAIQLTFADGTKSTAQVTVRQPQHDIAVLRAATPPSVIVPATLGNPNAIRVGSDAFVVGNPFGLYGSMSSGVVSGLGRSFQVPNSSQVLQNLIQVDAAVNPGNSGGPLLNRDGQADPDEDAFLRGVHEGAASVVVVDTARTRGMPVDDGASEERIAPLERVLYEVKKVIVGQDHLLERMVVALLARGHLLVEGVPGLAKTMAIKTLASSIGGDFKRIQFTPDLVPSDLVGTRIYNQKTGEFSTSLGPVFTNLLLADEINRAPAKVQSALLEVMQERQVTIGRETFNVPDPCLVLATQNPIETEGTYALPEAQVDRFMLKVLVGYPSTTEEFVIVERMTGRLDMIQRVLSTDNLLALQTEADAVYDMVHDVMRHRIVLSFESLSDDVTSDNVLATVLKRVPAPVVPLREASHARLGA